VGLSIGRRKGEILLDDPKVSSLHAFVEAAGSELLLRDNGSKNGIRVAGARVDSIPLEAGLKFVIGASSFRVEGPPAKQPKAPPADPNSRDALTEEDFLPREPKKLEPPQGESIPLDDLGTPAPPPTADFDASALQTSEPEPLPGDEFFAAEPEPAPLPAPAPAPPRAEVPPEGKRWHEVLDETLSAWAGKVKNQPQPLAPFDPAITLSFIGGAQAETVWALGYGPRRAGSASVDLPIFEPGAPEICFELVPSPAGVVFRTPHSDHVRINNTSMASKTLSSGDVITIGDTRIEIGVIS
jgi:pSer/pThr/pTyr-binding forkhead associated (FHA) protein